MGDFKQTERFLELVNNNLDLKLEQKIRILEYTADELFLKDENLLYLECKLAIKELRGQRRD